MGLKERGLRGSIRNVSVGVPTIPDSVVSRSDDDDSFDYDDRRGLRFESDVEWPEIGFKISQNTSGATNAEIERVSDETVIGSTDISGLSAGDTFTIEETIEPDTEYDIYLDDGSDEWTAGYLADPSFPYTSSDDDLTMITGVSDGEGEDDGTAYSIVEIGNVGFD